MSQPIYAGDHYSDQSGRLARVESIPAAGYITLRWTDARYETVTLTTAAFRATFTYEPEHKFTPDKGPYPSYLYCAKCGASETDHRL